MSIHAFRIGSRDPWLQCLEPGTWSGLGIPVLRHHLYTLIHDGLSASALLLQYVPMAVYQKAGRRRTSCPCDLNRQSKAVSFARLARNRPKLKAELKRSAKPHRLVRADAAGKPNNLPKNPAYDRAFLGAPRIIFFFREDLVPRATYQRRGRDIASAHWDNPGDLDLDLNLCAARCWSGASADLPARFALLDQLEQQQ